MVESSQGMASFSSSKSMASFASSKATVSLASSKAMVSLARLVIPLIISSLICIDVAHTQTCIKRSRLIPEPLIDTRLEATVASSITTYNELNCIHKCYQVKGCDGVNTKVNSEESTTCEILTNRVKSYKTKLVNRKGWKHYKLKVSEHVVLLKVSHAKHYW